MNRFLTALLATLVLALSPQVVSAQVLLSFQSFNGSVLWGLYPHTFIVMQGTLDGTGAKIDENYGYTAKSITPNIMSADVKSEIYIEKPKYITKTNRHFTVPISDAQYRAIRAEVEVWRKTPYNLDRHNCIHFVARIAEMVGIKAAVPASLLRKPRGWLNYVGRNNAWLNAKVFD